MSALILLEDWEQKPLSDKDYLVLDCSGGTQITYPISVSFDSPGQHTYLALKVDNISDSAARKIFNTTHLLNFIVE